MARQRGFGIDVEGLDELDADLATIYRILPGVMRDVLRGPVGDEILQEVRARASDNVRSGRFLQALQVSDTADGGVEVGIPSKMHGQQHPSSPRASMGAIGTWLESGTKMHMIPSRVSPWNKLKFNGRVVSRVSHPGTRRYRIMGTSLRVVRNDAERVIAREVEKRIERRIGVA